MALRYLLINDSRREVSYDTRPSPLETYEDDDFIKEFRMTKEEVNDLCEVVRPYMYTRGNRKSDLTVEEKVLLSLKTLVSGSFQKCSKDFLKVSQPTVSKTLALFTDVISSKARD